jgi:hypothetical protein
MKMPKFRGGKKSRVPLFVQGRSGRWHRVDPTDERQTACGVLIGDEWSFPVRAIPAGAKPTVCMYPQCQGVSDG